MALIHNQFYQLIECLLELPTRLGGTDTTTQASRQAKSTMAELQRHLELARQADAKIEARNERFYQRVNDFKIRLANADEADRPAIRQELNEVAMSSGVQTEHRAASC